MSRGFVLFTWCYCLLYLLNCKEKGYELIFGPLEYQRTNIEYVKTIIQPITYLKNTFQLHGTSATNLSH